MPDRDDQVPAVELGAGMLHQLVEMARLEGRDRRLAVEGDLFGHDRLAADLRQMRAVFGGEEMVAIALDDPDAALVHLGFRRQGDMRHAVVIVGQPDLPGNDVQAGHHAEDGRLPCRGEAGGRPEGQLVGPALALLGEQPGGEA